MVDGLGVSLVGYWGFVNIAAPNFIIVLCSRLLRLFLLVPVLIELRNCIFRLLTALMLAYVPR